MMSTLVTPMSLQRRLSALSHASSSDLSLKKPFTYSTPRMLNFLVESIPAGSTWTVAGVARHQLPMAALAIVMGGHVRVGLEDNLYYRRGELATNEQLVARVARIAEELQRPVATPDEAREILGLAGPEGAEAR